VTLKHSEKNVKIMPIATYFQANGRGSEILKTASGHQGVEDSKKCKKKNKTKKENTMKPSDVSILVS